MKDDKRKIKRIKVNGNSTSVVTAANIQIQIKIPSASSPDHLISLTFDLVFYLLIENFYLPEIEIWDEIIKNPPEISGRFQYEFQGQEYQSKEYLLYAHLKKEASVLFLPLLENTEKGSGTAGRFIALILEKLHNIGWSISPSTIIKDAGEKMEVEFQSSNSNLNLIMEKFVELITGIQDEMVRVIEILYPHQGEK